MILEDAHWADPTTLEAFGRVVDWLRTFRVLLIVTFRPEFQPPWIGRPYVTALTINRLTDREVGDIVDCLVGNKQLAPSIRTDLIERTDGIPLFVEEMTKALLEAETGRKARRHGGVLSPAMTVPASLHASLMARLDRLGSAKEVAQIGAAIGREFSHGLLTAVARKPEVELGSALGRLIGAGLLFRQGMPPHSTYLFKHALVQDAAYSTMLREARRSLHARIAAALDSEFPEVVENQPELLARHCTEAGLIEKAAHLWGKAAHRSLARSALVEAAAQLARAIDQIATLPSTTALRREEISLQVTLITPLIHIKGNAAPETRKAADRALLLLERAEALGESPEDPLLLFSVLYGFWTTKHATFNGSEMRKLAKHFLELAEKQTTKVPLMVGYRLVGISLLCTGDIAPSVSYFDRALALYSAEEHRPLSARFGQDARVTILSYRSLALWCLGYPDRALVDADQALNHAQELGQATTMMFALGLTSIGLIIYKRCFDAEARSNELIALAEMKGASVPKTLGTLLRGCVLALKAQFSTAAPMLRSGIAALQSSRTTMFLPLFQFQLAASYGEMRQFGDASYCINEAKTAMELAGETWCEAEIYRVAGEIALMSSERDATTAESNFSRALAVARSQQAKSWELRAAMSMARLWRDQGKPQQAYDLLAPVYGWFTEGFDTLDLREAKQLLDRLLASSRAQTV
jgi:predicted ATPase